MTSFSDVTLPIDASHRAATASDPRPQGYLAVYRSRLRAGGRQLGTEGRGDLRETCRLPTQRTVAHDLGDELRSVPCGNYLIIYRALPDGIELVRILHGAPDITAIFDREA